MAIWDGLQLSNGNAAVQPTVIASVDSFWQGAFTQQGNIATENPGVMDVATFYLNNNVTGLSYNSTNCSIFLGFLDTVKLNGPFSLSDGGTALPGVGYMQSLVKRDPGSPLNASITIYAPHSDVAPIGHVALIEAFTVNFDNNAPGDPFSVESQDAILSLTSRMYNYNDTYGPTFNGNMTNDILDSSTGLFGKGGFMTYADVTTENKAWPIVPYTA